MHSLSGQARQKETKSFKTWRLTNLAMRKTQDGSCLLSVTFLVGFSLLGSNFSLHTHTCWIAELIFEEILQHNNFFALIQACGDHKIPANVADLFTQFLHWCSWCKFFNFAFFVNLCLVIQLCLFSLWWLQELIWFHFSCIITKWGVNTLTIHSVITLFLLCSNISSKKALKVLI